MNLYLDIDGVLLTKEGQEARHLSDFLAFATNSYDCHWLTTHCKGDASVALDHCRGRVSEESFELLKKIKPTNWDLWKTEAIDFSQDFLWLDDCVFDSEIAVLEKNGTTHNKLIKIDLRENPDQLADLIKMKTELIALKGDITKLEVDAIVNAANRRLLGGGGVDGAIHRAAGEELYKECLSLNGCLEGEAKITKGHDLPAKYVIHTVGPIYGNENGRDAEMLHGCYISSLCLAVDNGVKTIAFPNISTGAYGYPIEEASKIAVEAVNEFLDEENHQLEKIYFVSFSDGDFEFYKKLLQ